MSETVFLVGDAIEGGLVARALGHSIYTDADSYDELRQRVRDAVLQACSISPGSLKRTRR